MNESRCANCGARRTGRYCSNCGQNDRDYQRALPPMLGEMLRETFEVDARLVQTMKRLLFQPGVLTEEFSSNRRASYVSPIRLYIFVSLAFFFLLAVNVDIELSRAQIPADVEIAPAAAAAEVAPLRERLDEAHRYKVDEILARPADAISRALLVRLSQSLAQGGDGEGLHPDLLNLTLDGLYEPRLAFERCLDNLPVAMFLMLPIYAGLLALLYVQKRRYFVEHLVFAVHVQTFVFLALIILLLLPNQTALAQLDQVISGVEAVLMAVTFVYQYQALRRYYGEGRLATLTKFSLLLLVYFVLLIPALLGVMFVAFAAG